MISIATNMRGLRCVFSINEFCEAHRISRSTLYKMFQQGTGPRVLRIGARRLISFEAAQEWRREIEALSGSETNRVR